jgi:hypothetical protein
MNNMAFRVGMILLFNLPLVCAADLYKCKAKDGSMKFQDTPCPVNASLVEKKEMPYGGSSSGDSGKDNSGKKEGAFTADQLYASWCLREMAASLDDERVPDRATYIFTSDKKLKYETPAFKQEDSFTFDGNNIKTKSMGNYKIISIKSNEMVLYYMSYMFFSRGACD